MKKYRRNWPEGTTELDIELRCFLHRLTPEQGGLGAEGHFWKCVELTWPKDGLRQFVKHPWAERMARAACENTYLSVSGPGGCGKSEFYAIWALINWMADPMNTLVIITSTSLVAARKRIWGSVKDYFLAAKRIMPGRLADSVGIIRTRDAARGIDGSDRSGIALIAGDNHLGAQNKIMGMHNKRVIVIGDELPELSPALVQAAMGNLKTNPWFQFIGIGNPKNLFDPHGEFSQPKNGWKSITEESEEWETTRGYAIRFDATKSPNILLGKVKYPFLPTEEGIKEAVEHLGADSPQFWRMWRGYWCPGGGEKGVYSDSEIEFSGGTLMTVEWTDKPIAVAGIDLGFTGGGDRSMAVTGLLGMAGSVRTLLLTGFARLNEDASVPVPRMDQIAKKFIAMCRKQGVQPQHAGFDGTAGGTMFGEVLARLWDGSVYRTDFSGGPSDLPHGTAGLTGEDLFDNRASELWLCGKDFLHAGQLRGIVPELAREMISRNCQMVKGANGLRQRIEPKNLFRRRTEGSPDLSDAYFVMLDLCRTVLGFQSQQTETSNKWAAERWEKFTKAQEAPEKTAVPKNLEAQPFLAGQPAIWSPEMDDGWGSMSFY